MFFSLNPERFFPYAQIDVVQFPDDLGGDRIIEKSFIGPLHQQLRDALQYIQNSIIQEYVEKLPDVAEAKRYFNYPYAAVEEALSNAVYHKGYDVREPIEVRVLPDRIEIVSHPGPDRSITEEGLRTYRVFNRRYRNRRIGEFLKEMRLTEGRNTGFRKILNALERNGSPRPLFETDPDRLSFCSTIFVHPEFLKKSSVQECKTDEQVEEQVVEQVEEQVKGQVAEQVSNFDEEIEKLRIYCSVPRSRKEMQAFLQIGSRKSFDKKYLKPLLSEGKLKMTVPDKPNSSLQKYISVVDK